MQPPNTTVPVDTTPERVALVDALHKDLVILVDQLQKRGKRVVGLKSLKRLLLAHGIEAGAL